MRADAARFLAYSEADGAAEALRPLARDRDPQVREAAAIGLTFLGQADHLEIAAVDRGPDARHRAGRVHAWQRVRLEEDPLIALARQHSDAAVDILGAALLGDLKGLRLVKSTGTPQVRLEGRLDRATTICELLGRTGNPRAARWLTAAVDLIARRPDLAEHFPRHELAESMLQFPDQAKDRIFEELETGNAAGVLGLRPERDRRPGLPSGRPRDAPPPGRDRLPRSTPPCSTSGTSARRRRSTRCARRTTAGS